VPTLSSQACTNITGKIVGKKKRVYLDPLSFARHGITHLLEQAFDGRDAKWEQELLKILYRNKKQNVMISFRPTLANTTIVLRSFYYNKIDTFNTRSTIVSVVHWKKFSE